MNPFKISRRKSSRRFAPTLLATLALGAATFGAASARAQYTGPSEGKDAREPLRTVAEARKNAKDDYPVRLSGVIAKKLRAEKYLFRDATGEIEVEIDAEDFPAIEINEKTRVELWGEIDKRFLSNIEIDVKRVRVPGETP